MKTDQMLKKLHNDCWLVDMDIDYSKSSSNPTFIVKVTCGPGARGRMKSTSKVLSKALDSVYKKVLKRWGSV